MADYAGNHGDLSPGAVGAATDFYYGGNGSGVIISVRPNCRGGKAIGPHRVSACSDPAPKKEGPIVIELEHEGSCRFPTNRDGHKWHGLPSA